MSLENLKSLSRVLEAHDRVSLRQLSAMLDVTPAELRQHIEAFNDVDTSTSPLDPMFRIEPAGGWPEDGPDPAPTDDDIVSFSPNMSGGDLGLVHADAATLGPLLAAADQLRSMEPGNLDLAAAVDVLRSTLLTNVAGRAGFRARTAAMLQSAADDHRRVRIVYSGAWAPKLSERVIEPYQVSSTSRGYELDAGPLDAEGKPRTFLVSRIRDHEVLEDRFQPEPRMAEAISANRALTAVSGTADHSAMWAVRHWAERVEQDHEDSQEVQFTAWLLPPVPQRVALICLVAGLTADGHAMVRLDEPELRQAVRDRAAALLAHHLG